MLLVPGIEPTNLSPEGKRFAASATELLSVGLEPIPVVSQANTLLHEPRLGLST